MQSSDNIKKLTELQKIINKVPLDAYCIVVLPEFGVQWKDVSQAVRLARLPMSPSSVARVLCRHAADSLAPDELDDIMGRLRLKLVGMSLTRTWHVIRLLEPSTQEPVTVMMRTLPRRLLHALRNGKHRNMRPEVQSVTLGDLLYVSVQFVSESKETSVLYMCTPPGAPVALVTSLGSAVLLKACVEGLGYKRYENAQLHGKHVPSLLRISDPAATANADQLAAVPDYSPTPTLLPNGIDYTNKQYDEDYVESLLGPNPPLLTDISIKSTSKFFDESRLDKSINLSVTLKSDDVSKSLKSWAAKGAIAPTSKFFQIFHNIRCNRFQYDRDSD